MRRVFIGAQCSQRRRQGRPQCGRARAAGTISCMTRFPLAQVTLCAVDTQSPALAAQSLLRSMQGIDFVRVFLFTHDWLPTVVLPGIEIIDIGPLRSAHERSAFVMRQLPQFIRSSHVLLTQWDGFVTHPQAWSDEFLVYDYVGAVWPDQPAEQSVGEGGFSLRSRRFLAAGNDPRITQTQPDDVALCRTHRRFVEQAHGVIFAPPSLAHRFAAGESGMPDASLGFCGAHHLPAALPEVELSRWLDELQPTFFASPAALRLLRALLASRMPVAAAKLLARRKAAGGDAAELPLLSAAARLLGAITPASRP